MTSTLRVIYQLHVYKWFTCIFIFSPIAISFPVLWQIRLNLLPNLQRRQVACWSQHQFSTGYVWNFRNFKLESHIRAYESVVKCFVARILKIQGICEFSSYYWSLEVQISGKMPSWYCNTWTYHCNSIVTVIKIRKHWWLCGLKRLSGMECWVIMHRSFGGVVLLSKWDSNWLIDWLIDWSELTEVLRNFKIVTS